KDIPEDAPASKLDKKHKNYLTDRDEVIANQVGAIMLKRAGIDIGDFKILPEVEASLRKTKLPDVNGVLNGKQNTGNTTQTGQESVGSAETFEQNIPSQQRGAGNLEATVNKISEISSATVLEGNTPRFD